MDSWADRDLVQLRDFDGSEDQLSKIQTSIEWLKDLKSKIEQVRSELKYVLRKACTNPRNAIPIVKEYWSTLSLFLDFPNEETLKAFHEELENKFPLDSDGFRKPSKTARFEIRSKSDKIKTLNKYKQLKEDED